MSEKCKCGAGHSKSELGFYSCGSPIKPLPHVYPHSSECYERQIAAQAQEIAALKSQILSIQEAWNNYADSVERDYSLLNPGGTLVARPE